MNKYLSRVTSSARGEAFNPLIWPSLFSTLVYGVGFMVLAHTDSIEQSSLYRAMSGIHSLAPLLWGMVAVATIVVGLTFLLFNIPPAGKVSGLVGFMVWVFAGLCWVLTGGLFLALAVAFPNIWFWIWQYLSLSRFKAEDKRDAKTLDAYEAGEYDAPNGGKERRESNRGVDEQ